MYQGADRVSKGAWFHHVTAAIESRNAETRKKIKPKKVVWGYMVK